MATSRESRAHRSTIQFDLRWEGLHTNAPQWRLGRRESPLSLHDDYPIGVKRQKKKGSVRREPMNLLEPVNLLQVQGSDASGRLVWAKRQDALQQATRVVHSHLCPPQAFTPLREARESHAAITCTSMAYRITRPPLKHISRALKKVIVAL